MEKRVYKETPLKIAVRVVAGVIGFMLLTAFLFTYVIPSRPMTRTEATGGLVGFGAAISVMLLTLLICWLAIKKRAVIVDLSGVVIETKRPFGRAEVDRFSWKDVSSTFLGAQTYRVRNSTLTNYAFGVVINGKVIYLTDKTFLNQNLRNLVAEVNAATRHLGYAWEECRADETRLILEAVEPFCKVALGGAAAGNVANQAALRPAIDRHQRVENPAAPKALTKKQLKQDALGWMIVALIFAALTAAGIGWDYHEQKKSWEAKTRASRFDFKTAKWIAPPPPPSMKYEFGASGLLPLIIICGVVSSGLFVAAVHTFSRYRRTLETPEMVEEDARREAIRNSPEARQASRSLQRGRVVALLLFAPIILMLIFKVHYGIYFSYLIFAAALGGVLQFISMRRT